MEPVRKSRRTGPPIPAVVAFWLNQGRCRRQRCLPLLPRRGDFLSASPTADVRARCFPSSFCRLSVANTSVARNKCRLALAEPGPPRRSRTTLALKGYGVWSLVCQTISGMLVTDRDVAGGWYPAPFFNRPVDRLWVQRESDRLQHPVRNPQCRHPRTLLGGEGLGT